MSQDQTSSSSSDASPPRHRIRPLSTPVTAPTQPWPTFSTHAAVHQTSIPLHAYIHLRERLEPYKRVLRVKPGQPSFNLSALRTVDELDYMPANRNLAIRQTFAHYFSSYLPSVVTSKLSSLKPNFTSTSSLPELSSASSSSASASTSDTPSDRSLTNETASWTHIFDTSTNESEFVTSSDTRFESTQSNQKKSKGKSKGKSKAPRTGLKALKGNVVILGGFRGSVLECSSEGKKSERVLWPNVQEAIFKKDKDPDLAMLLSANEAYGDGKSDWKEGEVRRLELANGVQSGKMLDRISFSDALPPVLDLGFSLSRRLERLEVRVEEWGYDFRADLEESTDELLEFLTKLKQTASDGKGSTVFAHSMGGLIVLNAISKTNDPSLFKQVIFFGTPFQGCPGIFSPFRYGDGFFRQVNLCNPFTSSSWPSSFYLLPHRQSFFTPDGKPIELDLSNFKTWDEYGLSPLASGISEQCTTGAKSDTPFTRRPSTVTPDVPRLQDSVGMAPARRKKKKGKEEEKFPRKSKDPLHPSNATSDMIKEHFERCVRRSKAFRNRLATSHVPGKRYPPMAIVAGNRVGTVKGSVVSEASPNRFVEEGYRSLLFDWGDGVVLWQSAVGIPGGWGSEVVRIVESRFGHMLLLADHESIDEALRACGQKLVLKSY